MKIYNFFVFFIFLFFLQFAFSAEEKNIKIIGNQYVDSEVIFSIIEDKLTDYSINNFNEIIKVLYETGNFKNIEIENLEDIVIIRIEENSPIKEINFTGNKRFKKEEIFQIFKKEDYFTTYNEIKINKFINDLSELYSTYGYNVVQLDYEINYLEENFVDINFSINEGNISQINKIYFIGNNNFSDSTLISKIKSNQKNYLMLLQNTNYKDFQVKEDLRRLINFYKNYGFKNVKITQQTEFISSNNKFNIYYYIDEGFEYQFRNIDIDLLNINLSEVNNKNALQLKDNFVLKKLKKKNIYNPDFIHLLKIEITNFLYDNGTVFFDIIELENVDDSNVDVLLQFVATKPKYINQINIYGNSRTKDEVIRRELPFVEGDSINNELIRIANRNLNNLRIFKNVSTKQIATTNNNVDFEIFVEEISTGSFDIGVGIDSYDGVTFISGLREKNIMGAGRELNFSINTSTDNTKYILGLVEPYIFNKKANFIYDISYTDKSYGDSSYNLATFQNNIGFKYDLTDQIKHTVILGYKLKDYTITDQTKASDSVKKLSGNNADILLNNTFIANKLDSFIRPTKGTYISYNNGISPSTNDDNGYIRNVINYKKYYKFKTNVFSIRGKLGNIYSLQNKEIPNDDKFSLGGRSLRGFDSNGVGPRNSRTSYVGGNNIAAANLDLHRPIVKNKDNPIDLNLFIDVGSVFDNQVVPSSSNETIRSSLGFGIKFYTIIGPIGFTWGFPITSEDYDVERMFTFSVGNLN